LNPAEPFFPYFAGFLLNRWTQVAEKLLLVVDPKGFDFADALVGNLKLIK
jgi:hypothetical protein